MASSTFFTQDRVNQIYSLFKYFYSFGGGILFLGAIVLLILGSSEKVLPAIVSGIIYGVIAFGLFKQKPWIPMVITLLGVYGIVANAITISEETLKSIFIIAILGFEIYFFNRKDVRTFLGAKKFFTFS